MTVCLNNYQFGVSDLIIRKMSIGRRSSVVIISAVSEMIEKNIKFKMHKFNNFSA